jgi:hypothetical protein
MMLQASDHGPTDTHGWDDLGSLIRRDGAALCTAICLAGLAAPPRLASGVQQRSFASLEAAVDTLVAPARSHRTAELVRLLGLEIAV